MSLDGIFKKIKFTSWKRHYSSHRKNRRGACCSQRNPNGRQCDHFVELRSRYSGCNGSTYSRRRKRGSRFWLFRLLSQSGTGPFSMVAADDGRHGKRRENVPAHCRKRDGPVGDLFPGGCEYSSRINSAPAEILRFTEILSGFTYDCCCVVVFTISTTALIS